MGPIYLTENVRSQVGALPDHCIVWHVLVDCPSSLNPILQEYVAVEPKVVPVRSTLPFAGLARGPQSKATVQKTQTSLAAVCWYTSYKPRKS